MTDVYVVELTAYPPGGPAMTLYYASIGFASLTTDTPASTHFDERLLQPADVKRDLFDSGKTSGRGRMAFGDLLLANADGALDVLLTYGIDGRFIIVRKGTLGAAYPASFTTVFSGTMEQPEADGDVLRVKLRDWQLTTDQPLQTTKYAGNNAMPAGLEGVASDLQGKPKPVCFGSVLNVPAICVNTAKLIYQVNDGALQSIPAVYDSGITLVGPSNTNVNAQFGASLPQTGFRSLAYGAGVFVAVGTAGACSSSADGTTWTARTSTFGGGDVFCVKFANGIFMIGGLNKRLATSPDGTTWTAQTLPAGWGAADDVYSITYGNGTWIAVGQSGQVATSTNNGVNWTSRTSGLGGAVALDNCAYGANAFVIIGPGLSTIAVSTDLGVTWSNPTPNASLWTSGVSITFGNGIFLATSSTPAYMFMSRDGTTWVAHNVVAAGGGQLDFTNAQFFLYSSTRILQSVTGLTWTVLADVSGSSWSSIVASDIGVYVAAGQAAGAARHYVASGAADYANTTDLQDDTKAPAPGTYKTYLAGGYFRLGSPPAGQVTADVTQGAAAANRTAGQLFGAALTKGGLAGTWNTTDVTNLDTANSAVLGYWIADEVTIAEVLDQIAGTVWAGWYVDASGVFRIKQFTAPTGTAVLTITANDILKPLRRIAVTDETKGLPSWRTILRYQRNYTVQESGLAAGVSDARKAFVSKEWRETKADDSSVLTVHLLAPQTVEETLFFSASDAATEASRRQAIRGVLRNRFEVVMQMNAETLVPDLNSPVTLQHARYGLAAGVKHTVLGISPNTRAREITFTLWG